MAFTFGDVFSSALQERLRREQDQQQFESLMGFKERQLSLREAFQNYEMNKPSYFGSSEKGYYKAFGGKEEYIPNPNYKEPMPTPKDPFIFGDSLYGRNPDNSINFDKPILTKPKTNSTSLKDLIITEGDKGYWDFRGGTPKFVPNENRIKKEPPSKLSEGQVRALNILENPPQYKTDKQGNFIDNEGQVTDEPVPLGEEEKQLIMSDNLNAFASNILTGRALSFYKNLTKQWKRTLTPQELTSEVIKHLQGGGISEQDAESLDEFLDYYEQFYRNLP
jgi:hypothetical protein